MINIGFLNKQDNQAIFHSILQFIISFIFYSFFNPFLIALFILNSSYSILFLINFLF